MFANPIKSLKKLNQCANTYVDAKLNYTTYSKSGQCATDAFKELLLAVDVEFTFGDRYICNNESHELQARLNASKHQFSSAFSLKKHLLRSKWVQNHHQYLLSPCEIQGELEVNGEIIKFYTNHGGFSGFWYQDKHFSLSDPNFKP